ncbi:hypothetical protein [Aliiroseovarius sp. Z3]|uniref:oxidoreductase n=1 Tax=Aliiroseovarius sp. Z3 TaxID=2811402 RepID=UPI0031B57F08
MTALFETAKVGALELPSRMALAPMTRCRTDQPGNIPNAMMAEYYAQRASAGLIITEATQISQQGQGYSFTPGIHSDEQVAGWHKVTDAVHRAGGRIEDVIYKHGQTQHFPDLTAESGFVHDLTNTGQDELLFVTVEFGH